MNTTMNIMYKTLLTVVLFTGLSANAQKQSITAEKLPAAAQTFLKTNFAGVTTDYVLEDKGLMSTEYEVRLANGTEIEFDGKGEWKEIDGNKNALPTAIVPKAITTYLATHYKGQTVHQIDKKRWGYEVELSNGLDLEFESAGKFLRIDD